MQKIPERRKNVRYRVPEYTFALINSDDCIGAMDNLSETGFLFEYMADKDVTDKFSTSEAEIITIFNRKYDFELRDIFGRIVYDRSAGSRNPIYMDVRARHCGVQFVYMDENAKENLLRFINSNNRRPV